MKIIKAIINGIRDFIYNITDYGLIITVVVIMAVILVWRFDLLFSRSIDKDKIPDIPIASKPIEEPEEPLEEEPVEEEVPSGLIASISIPQGTFPSKIAEILLNNNLINDKDAFLTRCVELNLDTRLQSGTFDIEVGTPLDDVIKIIAKTN